MVRKLRPGERVTVAAKGGDETFTFQRIGLDGAVLVLTSNRRGGEILLPMGHPVTVTAGVTFSARLKGREASLAIRTTGVPITYHPAPRRQP